MEQSLQATEYPVWFNGKTVNEALFCEEFLREHKMLFTNGAFFTPDGRVTNPLPLRREIYDKLEACADAAEHVGDCIETIVMKNT
jgi:putative DNA primase/helicase